jgi:hypothetical protein
MRSDVPRPKQKLDIRKVCVVQQASFPNNASRLSAASFDARLPPQMCPYPPRRQKLLRFRFRSLKMTVFDGYPASPEKRYQTGRAIDFGEGVPELFLKAVRTGTPGSC